MKTMRRNLAARSPLLRKGGAHQATPSGTRQRVRAHLAAAVEEWEEEREQPTCQRMAHRSFRGGDDTTRHGAK